MRYDSSSNHSEALAPEVTCWSTRCRNNFLWASKLPRSWDQWSGFAMVVRSNISIVFAGLPIKHTWTNLYTKSGITCKKGVKTWGLMHAPLADVTLNYCRCWRCSLKGWPAKLLRNKEGMLITKYRYPKRFVKNEWLSASFTKYKDGEQIDNIDWSTCRNPAKTSGICWKRY